jgi:peptide/nickel transport system permease protein
MRQNKGLMIATAILTFMGAIAMIAPFRWPYDPLKTHFEEAHECLSGRHLMGTDTLGRDVLSRVIAGTPVSFLVALQVLSLAATIGVPLGLAAAYCGGAVDSIVMRIADTFLAFPSFLLAMAITAALGPSLTHAMLSVAFAFWPRYTRIVRAQALAVKQMAYVEAARAIGATPLRIAIRHILINSFAPILIQLSMDAGYAILATAGLSFVGLGASPPLPEWGFMVAQNRGYITSYWWIPIFPGIAISLLVAGFMMLGDGLRDVLDPHLRGR